MFTASNSIARCFAGGCLPISEKFSRDRASRTSRATTQYAGAGWSNQESRVSFEWQL